MTTGEDGAYATAIKSRPWLELLVSDALLVVVLLLLLTLQTGGAGSSLFALEIMFPRESIQMKPKQHRFIRKPWVLVQWARIDHCVKVTSYFPLFFAFEQLFTLGWW